MGLSIQEMAITKASTIACAIKDRLRSRDATLGWSWIVVTSKTIPLGKWEMKVYYMYIHWIKINIYIYIYILYIYIYIYLYICMCEPVGDGDCWSDSWSVLDTHIFCWSTHDVLTSSPVRLNWTSSCFQYPYLFPNVPSHSHFCTSLNQ